MTSRENAVYMQKKKKKNPRTRMPQSRKLRWQSGPCMRLVIVFGSKGVFSTNEQRILVSWKQGPITAQSLSVCSKRR